ncbi:hypothetical protein NDU88_000440 [Pleurodeles waltl]|uniref:Uncharacterized protein n=1 Tax=Pleurodeles waltl TaxID=8319 RepID=A0AAV7NC78_PLEWA|nr:hypothetical protein NDU88_000440 [Pleurodeles waltl]
MVLRRCPGEYGDKTAPDRARHPMEELACRWGWKGETTPPVSGRPPARRHKRAACQRSANNETRSIRTLEEAQGLEGMQPNLWDEPQQSTSQEQLPRRDRGRSKTHTRQNKSHKPTTAESQKERAALLRSLRSQDSISEAD